MDTDRLNRWLTLGANLGVVAGLILLVIEIRQNTELMRQDAVVARADFGQGAFADTADVHEALIDPEFAATYAKMIESPEQLSLQEMIQLDHFFSRIMTMIQRDGYGAVVGVYEHNDRLIQNTIPRFFGNSYARAWWNESKSRWPAPIVADIDKAIAGVSKSGDVERYDRLGIKE